MHSPYLRRPSALGATAVLVLLAACTVLFAPPAAARPSGDPQANAVWQQNPPAVDGSLEDWAGAIQYSLNNQTASAPAPELRPAPSDLSAWTAIKWTSDELFVALNVTDNIVERTHRNWLLDDMAQFTFDIDNSQNASLGDIFLTISPDGMITNGGLLPSGFVVKTAKTATGWQAEISIPLREFGADFLTDAEVGFTWGVQDNDGSELEGSLVWAGPEFHTPNAQQGSLHFVNGPTREWIIVRRGDGNYNLSDVTLDGWNPNTNDGNSEIMWIRSQDKQTNGAGNSAIKFALPVLPDGARPLKARLHLTKLSATNTSSATARLYRLKRPWDENTATWFKASATANWTGPGAAAAGVDRYAEILSTVTLLSTQSEYQWEIPQAAIQALYDNPNDNQGFLIRADIVDRPVPNVSYRFHTSECKSPATCAPWFEVFIEKPPAPSSALSLEAKP